VQRCDPVVGGCVRCSVELRQLTVLCIQVRDVAGRVRHSRHRVRRDCSRARCSVRAERRAVCRVEVCCYRFLHCGFPIGKPRSLNSWCCLRCWYLRAHWFETRCELWRSACALLVHTDGERCCPYVPHGAAVDFDLRAAWVWSLVRVTRCARDCRRKEVGHGQSFEDRG